jgi:nucleotide-binding universal stress UspA family protein
MFKKIIWATDGSEHADRALALAKSLAREAGASLLVLHYVEHLAGPGAHGAFPAAADEDDRQTRIAGQVRELAEQGIKANLKLVYGGTTGAAHTIAQAAKEDGADVIVLGTRGHTALAGLLLGSVTQRLLHIAPCPVLAVPPEGR